MHPPRFRKSLRSEFQQVSLISFRQVGSAFPTKPPCRGLGINSKALHFSDIASRFICTWRFRLLSVLITLCDGHFPPAVWAIRVSNRRTLSLGVGNVRKCSVSRISDESVALYIGLIRQSQHLLLKVMRRFVFVQFPR